MALTADPIRLKAVNHLTYCVKDKARALRFWEDGVDEAGNPVYTEGAMPSGAELHGFTGLRESLHSERFVKVVTEKLMAYALGRRLEYYDQPAVRQIVREAAADDYRWSSIIVGIVQSPAFLMRMSSLE